jgi:ribosomal protein S3
VEVRVTPMRTEIIIRATRTQNVLGEQHAAVDLWQQENQLVNQPASTSVFVSSNRSGCLRSAAARI